MGGVIEGVALVGDSLVAAEAWMGKFQVLW